MAPVSEALAQLSTSIGSLADRAKHAEEQATAARNEAHDKIEARQAEAKAAAAKRSKAMKVRRDAVKDDISTDWNGLHASVKAHNEKIKAKLDEKRNDHDAAAAERRAKRAEYNAEDAVDFALYAIDMAEAEVLEAIDARVIADGLR